MVQQQMTLVEFAKRLSAAIFTMCEPHGEFYVAAKGQYLRLDEDDLNKKVFPDLFGEDAATDAEPDDIFLYWLGDWVLACKACLDPGTAESVASEIYDEPDVDRLRADIARLKKVPGFPQRGTFHDIDALEYPTFLRAAAKVHNETTEPIGKESGASMLTDVSKSPRRPRAKKAGGKQQSSTAKKVEVKLRASGKRRAAGHKAVLRSKTR